MTRLHAAHFAYSSAIGSPLGAVHESWVQATVLVEDQRYDPATGAIAPVVSVVSLADMPSAPDTAVTMPRRSLNPVAPPLVAPSSFDPKRAIETIRSFREGDEEEQREALEDLMQALDEHRPEGQKHFSKR